MTEAQPAPTTGAPRDASTSAPGRDEVRDASPLARVYGSPLAHRLLPTPAALALVGWAGRVVRERRNPAERRDAKRFLRDLLRGDPRAGQAAALAPRLVAEKARNQELLWRPWLLPKSSVEGREHWEVARAGGRGVVLVFGHVGPTWSISFVLALNGLPVSIVIGPHYWELPPGLKGIEFRHRRRLGERIFGAERIISSTDGPERLAALMARGESVLLAWDAPGRAATPFLGRQIPVGGAAARLAHETGAMVVPVVPERHGSRIVVRLHPPIDPAEHENARALRAAIGRTFEAIVLADPTSVELAWNPSPLVVEADRAHEAWGTAPA